MERSVIHHVEFCVRHGLKLLDKFVSQYGFKTIATKKTEYAEHWVVQSGEIHFLITQEKGNLKFPQTSSIPGTRLIESSLLPPVPSLHTYTTPMKTAHPLLSGSEHFRDTAFDVALEVKDVEACLSRLEQYGVEVIRPLQEFRLADDTTLRTATIKSCIGNVVHTLIQRDRYSAVFLPGYEPLTDSFSSSQGQNDELGLTHIDHIAFVCPRGFSGDVIRWYENCFGMKRFIVSRNDDEVEGFVIDEINAGLRLKVFEYWKCAEAGIRTDCASGSLKFVVSESLLNQGMNQIDEFLKCHGGPGIQHIGLHSKDIITSVSALERNGVRFATPPPTYYTQHGCLHEMQELQGIDVTQLQKYGILVDQEEDDEQLPGNPANFRYLLQKFSLPLFTENTFFFEIIQRKGAKGFGAGNITALFRSVQAYLSSKG